MRSKVCLIFLLISFCFTECKKGENDPLISLRTRKARVTGDWKMVKGFKKESFFGLSETSFTGDTYTETQYNPDGSTTIYSGKAEFTVHFQKDGRVNLKWDLGRFDAYMLSGYWKFNGATDETKNKEQIILYDESAATNKDLVYNIKELRNKKLVLSRKFSLIEEEFEFGQ